MTWRCRDHASSCLYQSVSLRQKATKGVPLTAPSFKTLHTSGIPEGSLYEQRKTPTSLRGLQEIYRTSTGLASKASRRRCLSPALRLRRQSLHHRSGYTAKARAFGLNTSKSFPVKGLTEEGKQAEHRAIRSETEHRELSETECKLNAKGDPGLLGSSAASARSGGLSLFKQQRHMRHMTEAPEKRDGFQRRNHTNANPSLGGMPLGRVASTFLTSCHIMSRYVTLCHLVGSRVGKGQVGWGNRPGCFQLGRFRACMTGTPGLGSWLQVHSTGHGWFHGAPFHALLKSSSYGDS